MSEANHPATEGKSNHETDKNAALAYAMASRESLERASMRKRTAELSQIESAPIPLSLDNAFVIVDTKVYKRLLDTSSPLAIDLQEIPAIIIDQLSDDELVDMALGKSDGDQDALTGPELRAYLKKTTEVAYGIFTPISSEGRFETILKQSKEAIKMGEEMGLDPIAIYENTQLYEELVRRTQIPIEFAENNIQMIEKLTDDNIHKMLEQLLPTIIQTLGYTNLTEDETEDLIREMRGDIAFMSRIHLISYEMTRTYKILAQESIVRFWGQEGFDSLPDQIKSALEVSK